MPSCDVCREQLKHSDFSSSELQKGPGEKKRCRACEFEQKPTPAPCPCGNPLCCHKANKENGEPCYHGWNDQNNMLVYTRAMHQLENVIDMSISRDNDRAAAGGDNNHELGSFHAVEAVHACERDNPIIMTKEFSVFLLSTAVDALVDGDPNLPPPKAPHLTQLGIYIEKKLAERDRNMTFENGSASMKFRIREVARIEAGDDIVPYLARRVPDDCHCLHGNKAYCQTCQKVVQASEMQRCGNCHVAQFCSRACQVRAWREQGHKQKWPQFKPFYDMGFLK